MAGVANAVSTMVCYRCADTLSEVVQPWGSVDVDALILALPWRTFRWYKGQKHYSGAYWASTVRDLVIYESRLELACLFSRRWKPLRWSCGFLVASAAEIGFLLTSIPSAWCVAGRCDARWSPG